MTELIKKEPLANIDYISIADAGTLKEIHRIKLPALVSLAVKFGKTRLIDNIVLGIGQRTKTRVSPYPPLFPIFYF